MLRMVRTGKSHFLSMRAARRKGKRFAESLRSKWYCAACPVTIGVAVDLRSVGFQTHLWQRLHSKLNFNLSTDLHTATNEIDTRSPARLHCSAHHAACLTHTCIIRPKSEHAKDRRRFRLTPISTNNTIAAFHLLAGLYFTGSA